VHTAWLSVSCFARSLLLTPTCGVLGCFRTVIYRVLIEDHHRLMERGFAPPQWFGELCWRERKLLIEPSMPDRSKDRGQTKCSPWSSRLGSGLRLTTPPQKNLWLRNLQRNHGRHKEPHRALEPIEKKKKNILSTRGSEISPFRPQYCSKGTQFERAEL
jgi:hypothetical protein